MIRKSAKLPTSKKILLAFTFIFLLALAVQASYSYFFQKEKKINGILLLTENTGDITGYYKWEKELAARGLGAIIKPEKAVLEDNPDYFRSLANEGYEIAIGYGEGPFWDMPYGEQYQIMKDYKEEAEEIIGQPVRIFSSKYFAYDDNTLKAADELGIEYILGRGTGLGAKIYQPEEYRAKISLVSNLEFGNMGSGSLCDVSLYSRGATAEEFSNLVEESLVSDITNLVLVSHVYIGGTRKAWWQVYQKALDSGRVTWRDFDTWVSSQEIATLPHEDIPYNTEVKYVEPSPAVKLDQLELVDELKNDSDIVVFHNGTGSMCLDFLIFADQERLSWEEHLVGEVDFNQLLSTYRSNFEASEGLSDSFSYYPIIFVGNRVFSGFDDAVGREILAVLGEIS